MRVRADDTGIDRPTVGTSGTFAVADFVDGIAPFNTRLTMGSPHPDCRSAPDHLRRLPPGAALPGAGAARGAAGAGKLEHGQGSHAASPSGRMRASTGRRKTTHSTRNYVLDPDDPVDEEWWKPGAFAPGRVGRDIVLDLAGKNPPGTGAQPRDTDGGPAAALGGAEGAAVGRPPAVRLSIEGISAFGNGPQGIAPAGGMNRLLRYPYRLLPWQSGPFNLLVALTMQSVAYYRPSPDPGVYGLYRLGQRPWFFTARQLRELTWCNLDGGLVLLHHDWPYPLIVRLPTETEGGAGRARRWCCGTCPTARPSSTTSRTETSASSARRWSCARRARSPPVPDRQFAVAGDMEVTIHWSPTGSDSYQLEWDTARNARDGDVRQRRDGAGAADLIHRDRPHERAGVRVPRAERGGRRRRPDRG